MGGMGGTAAASGGGGCDGLGRSFTATDVGNDPLALAEASAAAPGVPTGPEAAVVPEVVVVVGGLSLVEASPSPSTRLPTAG